MGEQYAILRFEKHRGNPAKSIEDHHERNKEVYASNPDVDLTRSKYNYHLIQPEASYREEIDRRIEEAGCRTRKDNIRFIDTLITASPEFFEGKNRKEIREFFQHACTFMNKKVGKQNIVSAVVHMDEKTPHMHLVFVPLTEDKRLSAKQIVGNRRHMVEWQNQFYDHMHKCYPKLMRGESVEKTSRMHLTSQEYKQIVHVEEVVKQVKKMTTEIGFLNGKKIAEQALKLLVDALPDIEEAASTMKRYRSEILFLKSENMSLRKRVNTLTPSIREGIRNAQMKADYAEMQNILAEIPQEMILEARRRLKEKKAEKATVKAQERA